jgi:hypothetical protein
MSAIKPLAETPETVPLTRADFNALLDAAEGAADLASVEAHRAYEDFVGWYPRNATTSRRMKPADCWTGSARSVSGARSTALLRPVPAYCLGEWGPEPATGCLTRWSA